MSPAARTHARDELERDPASQNQAADQQGQHESLFGHGCFSKHLWMRWIKPHGNAIPTALSRYRSTCGIPVFGFASVSSVCGLGIHPA